MATMTRAASSTSIFENSNTGNFGSFSSSFNRDVVGVALAILSEQGKNQFQELINSRCEYLDSLKTLRNDWISGGSVAPTPEIVEQAKKILIDFSSWLKTKENLSIPKLVMGPIPIGGIGIELIVEDKFIIYLNLLNDSSSDLEIQHLKTEHYIEIDTEHNSIEYLIKQAYTYLSL